MRRLAWSIALLFPVLSLACSSSGGGGKIATDVTSDASSDATTTSDTGTSTNTSGADTTTSSNDTTTSGTDTTTTDTGPVTCKSVTLSGNLAYLEDASDIEGDIAAFTLGTGEDLGFGGTLGDLLWIEFYADLTETGEWDLATVDENDNYATCAQCVTVYVDVAADGSDYDYDLYQVSGKLKVDAATPPNGLKPKVTLTNLKLEQVTINEDDATSTPVPGGACYTIPTVTLTTP